VVDCYYCDAEAVQECPRCGALYCDNHGEALCIRCQDPARALPSYRVYRGSLAALLIGTLLAVWLLLTPQSRSDADSPVPPSLSGLIETATATATASASPSATTVAAGPTPTSTATATATASATVTATPTETATTGDIEYTVGSGDTLYSIAEQYVPPGVEVLTFVDQIVAYNGIVDPSTIAVGQVLRIPR
jgi:LysM repeat protein